MSLSFPASPSVGQVYQNWIWNGTSWDSAVGVPAAQPGAKVLLRIDIVSAPVATVDWFTPASMFDGTYDELELHIYNVMPAAENSMQIRVSTDGSTFDGAANYVNTWSGAVSSTGANTSGGGAYPGLAVGNVIGITATTGFFGIYKFLLQPNTTRAAQVLWQAMQQNASNAIGASGGGFYNQTATVQGFRCVFTGAPNITRGTFKWYGIKK